MPPETNPRLAFERLFGAFDAGLRSGDRAVRRRDRRSILDTVSERTPRARRRRSARRIGARWTSTSRRFARSSAGSSSPSSDTRDLPPGFETPSGVPVLYADYVKLMFDLQVARVPGRPDARLDDDDGPRRQPADVSRRSACPIRTTRSPTTAASRTGSRRSRRSTCSTWSCSRTSSASSKATPDGDGTLLDHIIIVYGSGIADGDKHTHENLPVLLVGGGGGLARGPPHRLPRRHADDQLVPDAARSARRAARLHRRQHGAGRAPHGRVGRCLVLGARCSAVPCAWCRRVHARPRWPAPGTHGPGPHQTPSTLHQALILIPARVAVRPSPATRDSALSPSSSRSTSPACSGAPMPAASSGRCRYDRKFRRHLREVRFVADAERVGDRDVQSRRRFLQP